MPTDILDELQKRLPADFGFKVHGEWYQQGKCPKCGRREMFTRKDAPWILRCGRANRCGEEIAVKDHYRDLFEAWSTRFKPTPADPNASADAYLLYKRGLNLLGMRDAYSQETYRDYNRNLTSATVRFALPGGSYWERLIDQESRFDKKAHFKAGASYAGRAWIPPRLSLEALAHAEDIWLAEGIFDAWALNDEKIAAVSAMTVNNYPEKFLGELRRKCAELDIPTPRLVWAFDIGKAGTEYTKKWVCRALEDGWRATAAQPRAEGETEKLDWNDLKIRERLRREDIETYLWHGQVLLAKDASEKAYLIWERHRWSSFHFVFDHRTFWAWFDTAKIAETAKTEDVTEKRAAQSVSTVTEIANCAFRILYKQDDEATRTSQYYFAVTVPRSDRVYRIAMPPAALGAAGEFKKLLLGAGPVTQFTGSTWQLDRMVRGHENDLPEVKTLDFTGYSRDHAAWVLGDIAVQNGQVHRVNDEDYFRLGKVNLKLRTAERMLKIDYDQDRFDTSWIDTVWQAFGGNGMVTVVFWIMSFFAEQIRAEYKLMGFIEMSGIPGTGKSTLIEFLWKLAGRENYEGFDPAKATPAALARNLAKVANLPVVFMEGDRNDQALHSRKYDWDEIKPMFQGRVIRSRGVKNDGNETYEPPFRGALIIEQNYPINASPAVMERIMQMTFTKTGWNAETKAAAEKLKRWPADQISGTIVQVARREAEYMAAFKACCAKYEAGFSDPARRIRNGRIAETFAQLHAGMEAMAKIMPFPAQIIRDTHAHIDALAVTRDRALESDHKVVAEFWDAFDYLQGIEHEGHLDPINRHRDPAKIAVNLKAFEARCQKAGISHPALDDLQRHLRGSKSRPFYDVTTVNGIDEKRSHCWVFLKEPVKKGD